jgi:hypothetical protein
VTREKIKLRSDGGGTGGVWWSLRLTGVSTLGFVSVHNLIYFINKFCKYCTFNTIGKDNTAINRIIVRHKQGNWFL